jgi:hypothetical protein
MCELWTADSCQAAAITAGTKLCYYTGSYRVSFWVVLYDGDSSLGRRSMSVADIYMRLLHTNSLMSLLWIPWFAPDDIQ